MILSGTRTVEASGSADSVAPVREEVRLGLRAPAHHARAVRRDATRCRSGSSSPRSAATSDPPRRTRRPGHGRRAAVRLPRLVGLDDAQPTRPSARPPSGCCATRTPSSCSPASSGPRPAALPAERVDRAPRTAGSRTSTSPTTRAAPASAARSSRRASSAPASAAAAGSSSTSTSPTTHAIRLYVKPAASWSSPSRPAARSSSARSSKLSSRVGVVLAPPLVGRLLRAAGRRVLPLLLAPEGRQVEEGPDAAERLDAAAAASRR